MIYLLSAVVLNVIMTLTMKVSENRECNRYVIAVVTYGLGVVSSFLMMGNQGIELLATARSSTVFMAFIDSFFFVACFLSIQYSIGKNGAPLTATFNRMGLLIPTIASVFLFMEVPSLIQIVGIILCVIAIVYMNSNKGSTTKGSSQGSIFALLGALTFGGMADLMSKLYSEIGQGESHQQVFVCIALFFSLILSTVLCIIKRGRFNRDSIILGSLIAIPSQFTIFLFLKAIALMPAYIVYPAFSCGVIFLINLANLLIFREKLTKQEYLATAIIGFAIVLIAI